MDTESRVTQALAHHGQSHVLRHAHTLTPAARTTLFAQLAEIDLALIARLAHGGEDAAIDFATLKPAPYFHLGADTTNARAHGESLLRAGQVAAFTVAGGQGTRLGWKGPKGTYPSTVVTGKPLFRVFAEQITAAEKRWSCAIPWYIMTSPLNDRDTLAFFKDNNWFGRNPADTFLFPQGTMPSVSFDGKLMLETPSSLAVNPDGHGGAIRALASSGALEDMAARGIRHLSYFQVDNPLNKVVDPVFLGLHASSSGSSAEMSSKMVRKRDAEEKVGVFCESAGKTVVVEYSDMPAHLTTALDTDGALRFCAGSIAIHAISIEFMMRLTTGTGDGAFALPFHRAKKKVPYWCDLQHLTHEPNEPNATKFEAFVFDALALARTSLVMEAARVEEFAPIKNASGNDSPASSHQIQSNRNANWLEQFGVKVARRPNGDADARIEISAETALEADDLADVSLPREISAGQEIVL
ncbi:MAG: UDPGP type 1 family protein [Planctomycetota bacterium]|nr:MAG: UDPGP type 1 family protein [Planctomycetota bacterium]